jgi:N6-L-threonylcarbamoyladenine synthase
LIRNHKYLHSAVLSLYSIGRRDKLGMMKILGIETSCDETAAAIVENGRRTLTNVISSSLSTHQQTGGVIPENAAREQLHYILPVIQDSVKEATYDVIAVTQGPGLIGSLLIGVEAAKSLAWATRKPLIAVNHLHGHVYSSWLENPLPQLPAVVLIASGGHTDLAFMMNESDIQFLGGTRDDASGEAFDKTARMLGLSYPGGPKLSELAKHGHSGMVQLPRPMLSSNSFEFSFSGLKTAVRTVLSAGGTREADLALEIEEAITDVLVGKTIYAANKCGVRSLILGGGVVANTRLRKKFKERWDGSLFFPEIKLATDNAAAIAAAAYYQRNEVSPLYLEADASLSLDN